MQKVFLVSRIVLGLIMLVFGINFYFNVIPMTPPPMPPQAMAFVNGLMAAPYMMHLIKITEIVGGTLLLLGLYVPLALIVIAPLMLNILLFHAIMAPEGVALPLLMTACFLILIYAHWDAYEALLEPKSDTNL
jgi:uncharacterized membrane protein YphA (DoxX/SURF4 family)